MAYVTLVLYACGGSKTDEKLLPTSTGKYGEVLIIVDTVFSNGKTGDALDQIFFKSMIGLPQQEAQFRASLVEPKHFKSILKRSRNLLNLSIGKGKKTAINIENNVWAKDQLMIQITAASDEDAARILLKNVETIRSYYNEKEIERLKVQYQKRPEEKLMSEIEKISGVKLIIPPAFVKMASTENGCWIKKEKRIGEHEVLQGVSIYTYPYDHDSVFTNKEMISRRNEFTSKFIQGARDSSFMVVYEEYTPGRKEINLNGLYAVEYRGLWNMKNDFMGGPFLHYSFIDEKNNRVINLDGFVYAPKFNKREYLRELEAIMKTALLSVSKKEDN